MINMEMMPLVLLLCCLPLSSTILQTASGVMVIFHRARKLQSAVLKDHLSRALQHALAISYHRFPSDGRAGGRVGKLPQQIIYAKPSPLMLLKADHHLWQDLSHNPLTGILTCRCLHHQQEVCLMKTKRTAKCPLLTSKKPTNIPRAGTVLLPLRYFHHS